MKGNNSNANSNHSLAHHNFQDIPMPKVSYFASMGFSAPYDSKVWETAIKNAKEGNQVLLKRVDEVVSSLGKYQKIKSFMDINVTCSFDPIKQFTDMLQLQNDSAHRAPMVLFDDEQGFFPHQMLNYLEKNDTALKLLPSSGIVAFGSGDDNWGWLGSAFVNRTAAYKYTFTKGYIIPENGQMEEIKDFLDSPWLIMLLVSQHHNISHPKVISYPLGPTPKTSVLIAKATRKAIAKDIRISYLFSTVGSDWAFRPMLSECVKKNMGEWNIRFDK